MHKHVAEALLLQAKEDGHYSMPLPDYEDQLIRDAENLVEDAYTAFNGGMKGAKVQAIISLYESFEDPSEPSTSKKNRGEVFKELPIPTKVDHEAPDFPYDITIIDTVALRRLHSQFAALLARSNYLVAAEEAVEYTARQHADFEFAKAVRAAASTGEGKLKSTIEAEAAAEPDVIALREKQMEAYGNVKILKALRDTYQSNCERISREFTMRTEEWTQTK